MITARTGLLLFGLFFLVSTIPGLAADEPAGPKGPPPALVQVVPVASGTVDPMAELVGTVYYTRVAKVAAEVGGPVAAVTFEEGDRVTAGGTLVRLDNDILDTRLAETRATLSQARVELQQATRDLKRMETLFQENSVAESAYEEHLFRKKGLEHRVAALRAGLARLELEKEKKNITAPFNGIVIEKMTEKGEWLDTGDPVALLADDTLVDVVIDVPQSMLAHLHPGRTVQGKSNGREFTAEFAGYIPRGDIATRTFSVKLRLRNTAGLVEGMEARARLPQGPKQESLLVPRDAVLDQRGTPTVFIIKEGKAVPIPVTVTGYERMQIGVSGAGLAQGQQVVVHGNKRLRPGQAVLIQAQ